MMRSGRGCSRGFRWKRSTCACAEHTLTAAQKFGFSHSAQLWPMSCVRSKLPSEDYHSVPGSDDYESNEEYMMTRREDSWEMGGSFCQDLDAEKQRRLMMIPVRFHCCNFPMTLFKTDIEPNLSSQVCLGYLHSRKNIHNGTGEEFTLYGPRMSSFFFSYPCRQPSFQYVT